MTIVDGGSQSSSTAPAERRLRRIAMTQSMRRFSPQRCPYCDGLAKAGAQCSTFHYKSPPLIELRFAHLCDYAGAGANGKAIVVGIYDIVYDRMGVRPIPIPVSYFIAKLEASIADGTQHAIRIIVRHEDGEEVHVIDLGTVPFAPGGGPGRPLSAQLIMGIAGMTFPEQGDYAFEIWADGRKVEGEAPLYILPPPPE